MSAYLAAMRNYAVFRGRASRAQFWWFVLVYFVISLVAALIDQGLGTASQRSGLVLGLVQAVHFLPALGLAVRRLHDLDRTGWWMLIALTGLGAIVLLVFNVMAGTPGPNRFGPPPAGGLPAGPGGPAMPVAPPHAAPQAPRDPIAEVERLAALRDGGSLSELGSCGILDAQALARPRTP